MFKYLNSNDLQYISRFVNASETFGLLFRGQGEENKSVNQKTMNSINGVSVFCTLNHGSSCMPCTWNHFSSCVPCTWNHFSSCVPCTWNHFSSCVPCTWNHFSSCVPCTWSYSSSSVPLNLSTGALVCLAEQVTAQRNIESNTFGLIFRSKGSLLEGRNGVIIPVLLTYETNLRTNT
jgi:hypothetical protein